MVETQINLFDTAVIAIMVLSCLFAFFRGFVREILSLGAWIGAALVTVYYFPTIGDKLEPYFKNPKVATGFGTLGIYLLALIGFSIFNMIILKFFKQGSDIGVLDNLFGLMFGAFRGAFVISLAFFLVSIVLPKTEYPEWLQKSFTLPYVEKGARTLARAAPKYLENISTLQKDLQQQAKEDRAIDDQYEPAYGKDTRRSMDRLIESTGHE